MWAVIGMYGGQEDNAFFRRARGGIEAVGGRELPAGEVLVLGDDVIHSVSTARKDFAVALPDLSARSSKVQALPLCARAWDLAPRTRSIRRAGRAGNDRLFEDSEI
jgi:hypothetical protein